VVIDDAGNVSVDGKRIAALKIVDFPKPYALQKSGLSLFFPGDESLQPLPAADATVQQGFVEGSNINVVQEMTEMIETVRGYESYQRIIQFLSEINAKATNDVGRLG
jgi:flagellar basal-body rod protein FlgG